MHHFLYKVYIMLLLTITVNNLLSFILSVFVCFKVFLVVCVYVWCVSVYLHVHVPVIDFGCLSPSCSILYFLRQSPSLSLEHRFCKTSWPARPRNPLVSWYLSPELRLQNLPLCLTFCMDAVDLNSGLYAQMASTLPTELLVSLAPVRICFTWIFSVTHDVQQLFKFLVIIQILTFRITREQFGILFCYFFFLQKFVIFLNIMILILLDRPEIFFFFSFTYLTLLMIHYCTKAYKIYNQFSFFPKKSLCFVTLTLLHKI